jgi:hypothetical protein
LQRRHGCFTQNRNLQEVFDFIGERGGTRTLDPMIKSQNRTISTTSVVEKSAAALEAALQREADERREERFYWIDDVSDLNELMVSLKDAKPL